MLKYYYRYTSGATSTLPSSSPPLLLLSLPSNYYNSSYTTTTLRICFFSIRITALKFGFQEVRRSTHCRARRRVVRYNDEDEDDDDEEFEYGHNAEIAMLELYSQSARDEALLVTASVDDQEALVLIFKKIKLNCSYPKSEMDESREIALTQMRKSVEKLGSSTQNYGDRTLMRFLIARTMDPDKAAKMFVQWKKWRAALVPLGFIPDSEVQDELEARKIYLQGLSKDGYPVMIVKSRKHFPSKDQLQFKKFVVHLLDKTIASSFKGREIGNEKLIGVLDLQQITYKNIDARALITGFQFLQAYYPERLAKCYLLNMPGFFVSVWRMVSYFLEKATLEKIVIVSNEDEKREFIRNIGEEALPAEYGGRAKLVAIQDVILTPMEN